MPIKSLLIFFLFISQACASATTYTILSSNGGLFLNETDSPIPNVKSFFESFQSNQEGLILYIFTDMTLNESINLTNNVSLIGKNGSSLKFEDQGAFMSSSLINLTLEDLTILISSQNQPNASVFQLRNALMVNFNVFIINSFIIN